MQKHANLVDLVKSFPTNIFLQNLAPIQKRTSPIKFAHLAEKSEKGSTLNLPAKAAERDEAAREAQKPGAWKWAIRKRIWDRLEKEDLAREPRPVHLRSEVNYFEK